MKTAMRLELVFQPDSISLVNPKRQQRIDIGGTELLVGYRMLIDFNPDNTVSTQFVVHPNDPKPPEFTGERAEQKARKLEEER